MEYTSDGFKAIATKETTMSITVQIRQIYGNETIYPICEKAKLFAAIAGTKTLTLQAIAQIKLLGYAIEIQPITRSL
jgi:hypothetical protein